MIGREHELEELGAVAALRTVVNARGERIAEEPAPLVIVYGGASTGKSMCVAQALRRHAEVYAMVDCTAIYSAQEFYREILVQLYKNLRDASTQPPSARAPRADGQCDERGDVGEQDEVQIEGGGCDDAGTLQSRPRRRRNRADSGSESGNSDAPSDHSDADHSDAEHAVDTRRASSSSEQSAIARAKRVRAQQREQQEQRDAAASSTHVSYEGYNSLNFLSFIKALGKFVAAAAAQDDADAPPRKRVVYLALDQVDKLLDRGLAPLLTCIFRINDHLAYLHMFSGVMWDVSVLLITRALSLEFDRLVSAFFPAHIAFPPYTNEQVADILVEQLQMQSVARVFRRWLLHLSSLVPASQGDWLEFRRNVVHLLPDFDAFFAVATSSAATAPTASITDDKFVKKLLRTTNERASAFEKTRRKHLFGHNKLQRSGGDPTDTIACTDLSRSCLLLVVAGYLASFNPQETDTNFLSSSGGVRRKKRAKKTGQPSAAAAEQISQFLIGPRIFTLQRLLAIYLNLRAEATADISDQFAPTDAREDIFIHLATLVRMQLFQRTSPPTMLDDIKFRCLADSRFVHETAKFLRFPLESYLNTGT